MNSTNQFKNVIKAHLDNRAKQDPLFAASYKKEDKNIDQCINFILNSVKESKRKAFTDEEIYSLAVHYYDEDSIKEVPKAKSCTVVCPAVELTEEDKEEAKRQAIEAYKAKLTTKKKHKHKSIKVDDCPSLF